MQETRELVDRLFRERAGRMVAYLTRAFGPSNLDLVEEVVQDAVVTALQQWPYSGIPDNPAGWLFRVARNRALDVLRRHALFTDKAAAIAGELVRTSGALETDEAPVWDALRDDELRMIVMCCHPALSRDARVALSLKAVCGFSVREIARAFLAEEPTIAQRLVRAKRQIRELGITLDLPDRSRLDERLDSVLEVLYLLFNEGYSAHGGQDLIRHDLCGEALRLGRLLATSPPTARPRVHALVALMAFLAARLPARLDPAGDPVPLEDQDRSRWDAALIRQGFHHFALSAEGVELSEYHVQAAIQVEHARAGTPAQIDWRAIRRLYDQLYALNPSPIVALHRTVVIGKVEGPAAALRALAPLARDPALTGYHLLPALQGHFHADEGRYGEAAAAFRAALERPCSEPEQRLLRRKLAECERRCIPGSPADGR